MPLAILESPEKELEIEFLRCGTHTSMSGSSHNFTHDIAQEIVDTYNPDNFKAPLIVSHETGKYNDREIVNSELAFGTPKLLKKVGDRLKAVFEKISPEFIEWVRNNQILGISPSFYPPDHHSNPTPGKWSLRHIAGLGKSPPAIKGLASLSLSEFFNSPVGAIDLGEFEYSTDNRGAVTLDFEVNALSEETSDKHCIDFMVGEGYEVFQRLRDYLIEKEGVETADRIIPSYYLQAINEPQPKYDYPFEFLTQLMMRGSDLENRLNPAMPIYSESVDFKALVPKTAGAKEKNCKKGTPCKGTCINANKTCRTEQSPDSSTKTKQLKASIKGANQKSVDAPSRPENQTSKASPKNVAPDSEQSDAKDSQSQEKTSVVSVRTEELKARRDRLVEAFGKEEIEATEKNMQRILDESDVFIRVPSNQVLDKIVNSRFKSTLEIPGKGKDYNKRRVEQEKEMFGYDKDFPKSDRAIYGYYGSNDFNSVNQKTPSNYGDIAVKLKPQTKERATVTGTDSFSGDLPSKSGAFNAASLAGGTASSDLNAKSNILKENPYARENVSKSLAAGKNAKDLDDYIKTGGKIYLEAQIHGQVKPSDIAEIHYTNGSKPDVKVEQWAKKNNVKLIVH